MPDMDNNDNNDNIAQKQGKYIENDEVIEGSTGQRRESLQSVKTKYRKELVLKWSPSESFGF